MRCTSLHTNGDKFSYCRCVTESGCGSAASCCHCCLSTAVSGLVIFSGNNGHIQETKTSTHIKKPYRSARTERKLCQDFNSPVYLCSVMTCLFFFDTRRLNDEALSLTFPVLSSLYYALFSPLLSSIDKF